MLSGLFTQQVTTVPTVLGYSSLVMVTHAISFVFLDSYFRFLDHIIQENYSYALDLYSMQALNDENSWCPGFWIVLDSFGEVLDSLDCFG
jgi:hypothetical protein